MVTGYSVVVVLMLLSKKVSLHFFEPGVHFTA